MDMDQYGKADVAGAAGGMAEEQCQQRQRQQAPAAVAVCKEGAGRWNKRKRNDGGSIHALPR